ncbi:hypothetical protein SAMN05421858_3312 [Haladaptatus litoreus]|uniref:Uncharacterized protein n=1 Tax=Haladaptatus litoreus TaxID=553468 RepID=A0A1N7CWP0_9EURY|nr:hypothetical protein [Haladaptatus litoreus]SIR68058.1 hypothetical protein SAMN05421858_3312 [Haladaptatus litoreus]
MTDANPFDDLSEVENDDSGQETSETSTESASNPLEEPAQSSETTSTQSTQLPESSPDESTTISGPSFEYSEVRQRPLYARGETWDELEDAIGITVVPELRRQGIRDEEKREIHDAVLTLAVEEPERLVEIIAERRQQS